MILKRVSAASTREATGLKTGHYHGGPPPGRAGINSVGRYEERERGALEMKKRQTGCRFLERSHSYPGRIVAREVYLVK